MNSSIVLKVVIGIDMAMVVVEIVAEAVGMIVAYNCKDIQTGERAEFVDKSVG